MRHGTRSSYVHGCRCTDCRAAAAEYAREMRGKRKAPTHGTVSGYSNHGCRCAACKAAGSERNAIARRKRSAPSPEVAAMYAEASQARSRRIQAETLEAATNHYKQWTGPELELAARDDLTVAQAAKMLGRSASAVRNMRNKLKADPRKIKAAGIGSRDQGRHS